MIIGITGFAGSGKDTFKEILIQEIGNKFNEVNVPSLNINSLAFAQTLKKALCEIYDLNSNVLEDRKLKESNYQTLNRKNPFLITVDSVLKFLHQFNIILDEDDVFDWLKSSNFEKTIETPRKLMQIYGTEIAKILTNNPTIHIDKTLSLIENTQSLSIISDVRFLDEFYLLKQYAKKNRDRFYLFYIDRRVVTPEYSVSMHQSEKEVFYLKELSDTIIINNHKDLSYLRELIQKEVKILFKLLNPVNKISLQDSVLNNSETKNWSSHP